MHHPVALAFGRRTNRPQRPHHRCFSTDHIGEGVQPPLAFPPARRHGEPPNGHVEWTCDARSSAMDWRAVGASCRRRGMGSLQSCHVPPATSDMAAASRQASDGHPHGGCAQPPRVPQNKSAVCNHRAERRQLLGHDPLPRRRWHAASERELDCRRGRVRGDRSGRCHRARMLAAPNRTPAIRLVCCHLPRARPQWLPRVADVALRAAVVLHPDALADRGREALLPPARVAHGSQRLRRAAASDGDGRARIAIRRYVVIRRRSRLRKSASRLDLARSDTKLAATQAAQGVHSRQPQAAIDARVTTSRFADAASTAQWGFYMVVTSEDSRRWQPQRGLEPDLRP